jgi:RsmE family RNA methyltransferase
VNVLLFHEQQVESGDLLTVTGRQHKHLHHTLAIAVGDQVKVGQINGLMGNGEVLAWSKEETQLRLSLGSRPPEPLAITLILALPRPKMLKRTLQSASSLGIKDIHLINSYRVEKSFWQTPWLAPEAIQEQLILGLEQSGDTLLPSVTLHKRFKPFVEDIAPALIDNTKALVAHPYTATPCPIGCRHPLSLAIGPEGGFIPYEIEKLLEAGFEAVTLGSRILRVETAIPVLISRLTAII